VAAEVTVGGSGEHDGHWSEFQIQDMVRLVLREELMVRIQDCEPRDVPDLGLITREIVVYLGDEVIDRGPLK